MLTIYNISKSYGLETILSNISFNLNSGERLALVGPNGSGKTTLLRIISGEESPDAGSLHRSPSGLSLGYLPQGFTPSPSETISSFIDKGEGDTELLAAEIERLAASLAIDTGQTALQEAYDLALEKLTNSERNASRVSVIMAALGLGGLPPETPVVTLSGGQKTRLALAGVLLADPQVLLLDEPTNHLDLEMLEWLENWLAAFRGAVLFVSHDRAFLDRTSTGILEIDGQKHTLKQYPGNYSNYLRQKLVEREHQMDAYKEQQEEIAQLRKAVNHLEGLAVMKRGGKGDSGDKFAKGFFANRTRRVIGRSKQIERRIERLLNEERVDKPQNSWQMKMEFGTTPSTGRDVLLLENLAVGYGEKIILFNLNLQLRYGARAVLVGPNGSGKTTLLRTIAGIIPPLNGNARLGSGVRLGYMRQEQEELNPLTDALTMIRGLAPFSETDARAFLHKYLFSGDEVFTPVGLLSYGERARLSLAGLVAQGCNLLLLDEPINHLDIPSRTRFEQALINFEGTILAVVHDRYFIEGLASEIWEVQESQVNRFEIELDFD